MKKYIESATNSLRYSISLRKNIARKHCVKVKLLGDLESSVDQNSRLLACDPVVNMSWFRTVSASLANVVILQSIINVSILWKFIPLVVNDVHISTNDFVIPVRFSNTKG